MEIINGAHIPARMLPAARQLAKMLLLVEDMRVTEDSKEFGLFWALPLQQNDFHLFPALPALSIMCSGGIPSRHN